MMHEIVLLRQRAIDSHRSWELSDCLITPAEDCYNDNRFFSPANHLPGFESFCIVHSDCLQYNYDGFAMRIEMCKTKLMDKVTELFLQNRDSFVLDHSFSFFFGLQTASENRDFIHLSQFLVMLKDLRVVVVCSNDRKRKSPEEVGGSEVELGDAIETSSSSEPRLSLVQIYCYIVEVANIEYMNEVIEQHREETRNPEIFHFTFPEDCNILVLACRTRVCV